MYGNTWTTFMYTFLRLLGNVKVMLAPGCPIGVNLNAEFSKKDGFWRRLKEVLDDVLC